VTVGNITEANDSDCATSGVAMWTGKKEKEKRRDFHAFSGHLLRAKEPSNILKETKIKSTLVSCDMLMPQHSPNTDADKDSVLDSPKVNHHQRGTLQTISTKHGLFTKT